MSTRLNSEALFLQHLHWINKVAAMACKQHGLSDADAEDFAGWLRLKLMENDYAAIRNFRGESRPETYLMTVVVRQFHEYKRVRYGRWRASAAAERLGSPAPELEALVHRDGYLLSQAGEKLRTSGRSTLSDVELAQLLSRLPERMPLRPLQVPANEVLNSAADSSRADERVTEGERAAERQAVIQALNRALGQLNPEERQIATMHFADGRTVHEVARALGLPQKPLYRRIERIRKRLREHVQHEGISAGEVRAMLAGEEPPFREQPAPEGIPGTEAQGVLAQEQLQDFHHPGIVGPDGRPITQEDLHRSRIITDVRCTNEKILRMVRKDPRAMYNLSPRQFEQLVAELLDEQGYQVALTPPSNDRGFDICAARKDGLGEFLYLVECKRYAPFRPVGVNVVRALYGVVQTMRASAGIVVTTSHFTKGAKAFQQTVQYQLSLRDYFNLQQWLGMTIIEPPLETVLA